MVDINIKWTPAPVPVDDPAAVAEEIKKRGFKKVFLVSDKSLVEAGVTKKVEEVLEEILGSIEELERKIFYKKCKKKKEKNFLWRIIR